MGACKALSSRCRLPCQYWDRHANPTRGLGSPMRARAGAGPSLLEPKTPLLLLLLLFAGAPTPATLPPRARPRDLNDGEPDPQQGQDGAKKRNNKEKQKRSRKNIFRPKSCKLCLFAESRRGAWLGGRRAGMASSRDTRSKWARQ